MIDFTGPCWKLTLLQKTDGLILVQEESIKICLVPQFRDPEAYYESFIFMYHVIKNVQYVETQMTSKGMVQYRRTEGWYSAKFLVQVLTGLHVQPSFFKVAGKIQEQGIARSVPEWGKAEYLCIVYLTHKDKLYTCHVFHVLWLPVDKRNSYFYDIPFGEGYSTFCILLQEKKCEEGERGGEVKDTEKLL